MEQGYKHFSHVHNLIIYQLPQGVEVSCSACNSSGAGTVFVCWQCNFFLHEQCYRATRSLKHPSHPLHPLTLVPYPAYPSNSFYCNSCEIIGTGLSYSCADCEFDLHVQCAFSISRTSSFQTAHQNQELLQPGWYGVQNSNMTHNVPFVSVHDSHPIPFSSGQHPYLPPNSTSDAQYGPMRHDVPGPQNSVHTAQDRPMAHNLVSVYNHMSTQNPTSNAQYPSMAQNGHHISNPSNPPNPFPMAQDPSMHHLHGPAVSVPNESGQNPLKDKGIRHFSHAHELYMVNLKDRKNEITCSGCEKGLDGKGYSCVEPNCNFHLHESCFHLEKEIQHKSHPGHPLTLLPIAPYNNKSGQFTCSACFTGGTGFTYHCSICSFDLHIRCVNLPETVRRTDHDHELKLLYSCPLKGQEYTYSCDVCHEAVQKDRWAYYCGSCDYCTHLGCVNYEELKRDSDVLDVQVQLQRLQMEMEMARQHAQLIASMGASIASLV